MAAQRLSVRDVLSDGRLAVMLLLGFSAGLPFLLVFGTLSAWLREAGISRTEIGLLSYVGLAYAFKFLWAPVIDAVDPPVLGRLFGRRRGWMILAQFGVAAGLTGLALGDPKTALMPMVICALMTAFFSATQDVVIDGWRIDAAPASRQGLMSAAYQLGYRFALIASGAGALYIAELVSWRAAYLAMAGLMTIGIGASLLALLPGETTKRERLGVQQAVVEPFADLLRRKGTLTVAILLMVALYRLPDFVAGVMANPLYIDTGFSKIDIANVSKLYGVWVGILGAIAGGIAVSRIGLWWTLVIGAAIAAGSNVMFAVLSQAGPRLEVLTLAISIDNFSGNFAGTALIAYMSSLTSASFAATQYALLSSLYALPGKLVGGTSGIAVDAFGYAPFFVGTALIGIPVVLLCILLRSDTLAAEARAAEEARREEAAAGAEPRPAT